jgi:hypothetical protein
MSALDISLNSGEPLLINKPKQSLEHLKKTSRALDRKLLLLHQPSIDKPPHLLYKFVQNIHIHNP